MGAASVSARVDGAWVAARASVATGASTGGVAVTLENLVAFPVEFAVAKAVALAEAFAVALANETWDTWTRPCLEALAAAKRVVLAETLAKDVVLAKVLLPVALAEAPLWATALTEAKAVELADEFANLVVLAARAARDKVAFPAASTGAATVALAWAA